MDRICVVLLVVSSCNAFLTGSTLYKTSSVLARRPCSTRRCPNMTFSFSKQRGSVEVDNSSEKCPVLICPAQLGVAKDYLSMVSELNARGFPAYGADLTRLGWITGLLPSAISPDYWTGNLTPDKTLKFYFEGMDRTMEIINENHPGQGLHIVGHSIGGWVARAWLAETCSPEDQARVLTLTTLGTPNNPPPENGGPWAALDQTRGLLKDLNRRFPGAYVDSVAYTSVVGTALKGKFPGSLEEMLAFVSYLPLGGDGTAQGDGIVPRDIGIVEGSNIVEIPLAKHSGFIPFPGDAIQLGDAFPWYGDPNLMGEWVGCLDAAENKARIAPQLGKSIWESLRPW